MKNIRWAAPRSWSATLASVLPLWLLSFAIMAEGFPRPPISVTLAIAFFMLAIAVSIVLFWKRWMTIELILCSLVPLVLLITFDEISTTYKSPFIILCTLLLTAGMVAYQRSHSARWRWLILVSIAVVTCGMASHAASRFWQMAGDLGYRECFPDAQGCAPLAGQETPWWTLFFGL